MADRAPAGGVRRHLSQAGAPFDNDGLPSADRIVPDLQDLRVGDRIEMIPGMGPIVRSIDPPHSIVSTGEADSRCLALYRQSDGTTRLVSRWRANWPRTLATYFWIAISDPGSFVMERRMLKGIKRRAERVANSIGMEDSDDRRREGAGTFANAG